MKQLLILSGKGGTGKTTTAAAFIRFAGARAFADCDVDAPNLHIVADDLPEEPERRPYYGSDAAQVDEQRCTGCGLCAQYCRFGAIRVEDGRAAVRAAACEGCGVCAHLCPAGAVSMVRMAAGDVTAYRGGRTFVTASLRMGRGNSGKLVSEVKTTLVRTADGAPLAIIDGSPGIGCPVMASITGVDRVLVVAEPSLSGLSDLERIVHVAQGLQTPVSVCINKWDASPDHAGLIEAACARMGVPVLGKIPFDSAVPAAVNAGQSIADIACPARDALCDIFEKVMKQLQ